MPALAQAASRRPCSERTRCTAASQASVSTTSSSIVSGVGVSLRAVSASASASRSASTTVAPLRASSAPVPAPIPRAPPVIRMTFSFRLQAAISASPARVHADRSLCTHRPPR